MYPKNPNTRKDQPVHEKLALRESGRNVGSVATLPRKLTRPSSQKSTRESWIERGDNYVNVAAYRPTRNVRVPFHVGNGNADYVFYSKWTRGQENCKISSKFVF